MRALRIFALLGARILHANWPRILRVEAEFAVDTDCQVLAAPSRIDGLGVDGLAAARIINAGIMNGAPSQYILQLRRYLDELQPDVVIVCLAPNDVTDDSLFERTYGFILEQDGYPLMSKTRTRLRMLRDVWLLRYLEVFSGRFSSRWHGALFPPATPEITVPPWPRVLCTMDEEAQDLSRRRTGRSLVHLKEMAEGRHAKLGVLMVHYGWVFPNEPYHESQVPADLKAKMVQYGCPQNGAASYSRFVEGFLEENGIPFRNPYAELLAAKTAVPSRKLWHFYDYHFSPAGHQVMGRELAELLRTLM